MRPFITRAAAVAAAALLAITAAGCSADAAADAPAAAADGAWPRTVEHELGETVIAAKPERIVSTSLTITGTLLAIDAPIVASAASTPGGGTSDDRGFFVQWSDIAAERGVDVLYPDLEVDIEAVIAAEPDLIVVSTSGADSTADAYEQLSDIAPTVVYNYGDKTWQDLAVQIGEATGLEAEAQATIDEFDARVAEVADAITVPEGEANAVVYSSPENDVAFAKPGGAHADLLGALGFDVVGAPDEFDTSAQARQDFAFISLENTTKALSAPIVFIVAGDEPERELLLDTPVLQNAPAVAADAVFPLGDTSFRIDYFSANQVVDRIADYFG